MNLSPVALLTELASKRPVFHSEADFQHALAWQLHETHKELSIRLEYPMPVESGRIHVDVWASNDSGNVLALELKYKTRKLQTTVNGEAFTLQGQAAQNHGRYDTIKDLYRLERLREADAKVTAWGLLLTNDSAYWTSPPSSTTVDASFRLHEGRNLCGDCAWGPAASAKTLKKRAKALTLSGSYALAWRDYSTVSSASYGRFRYLAVQIA